MRIFDNINEIVRDDLQETIKKREQVIHCSHLLLNVRLGLHVP